MAVNGADRQTLSWLGIIRLGLVQTAIGAIVVLTTSTLNRVMVVELALPAMLPGALVGWHYAVQLSRPRWGYGADQGGSRTRWIIGGMFVLAIGATAAAGATALMATSTMLGLAAAALAFTLIGGGVGASGTNLLALLAAETAPERKAAAAAIVWIMMIVGFVVTTLIAAANLDPFSLTRLVTVTAAISVAAVVVAALALIRLERPRDRREPATNPPPGLDFGAALKSIWGETQSRRFTIFIFASMLAYSAQDLILEPLAGLVYDYTPAESTKLASVQNQGVLLGMIVTAIIGTTIGKSRARFMRAWTVAGCIGSAAALASLAGAALVGPGWPLKSCVFALGLANGAFAVAAIGSMMTLASAGGKGREGTRMGLWGASQAIAFGLGGFLGAVGLDVMRLFVEGQGPAFATVFAVEAIVFVVAAWLAIRVGETDVDDMALPAMPSDLLAAE
ncbi:MAG: BCD family MFS transporter [Pseudomonadota bacterium]